MQIGSFLSYVVQIKDRNGTAVYNETVRNLQLIITLDPCGQYTAIVAPLCQGTATVAFLGGSQIPGGKA